MKFAHPKMLILLAISVPLLSWFLWMAWRRKQAMIAQFVQSRLLAQLTVGVSKGLQKARLVLVTLAVGLLLLSLARPQWGTVWEEARQRGRDIVVAIDTSRSMLAEDVRPNRLRRSKLAALDLMRLAKHDRLGLVAFAGTAFLQCPLTLDDEAFRQSVEVVDTEVIPQGGTAIHEAIATALTAFEEDGNHKVLVLFTDGEDHESGIEEAINRAQEKNLQVFTIGVGTPSGELLSVLDENGKPSYVKDDDGNVVKSRLNEALLTKIATETDGFYLPLAGANPMEVLYEKGIATLPTTDVASKLTRRMKEQFQWPLALAILLLLIEMFLPDQRKVRRSAAIQEASTNRALREAVTAALLLLCVPMANASPSGARKDYEAGRYDEARQEYLRLLNKKPDDQRLDFNAGASAYQAQKFDEAAKHFQAASQAHDLKLQQGAYYNLGNSMFRLGEQLDDPQAKTATWEKAVEHYESSLKLNSSDEDAQHNLGLVKKKLEELKQQQQQKNDPSKKDDGKESDDQKDQNKDPNEKNQDQKQQDQKQDQQKKDEQKKDEQNQSGSKSEEEKKKEEEEKKKQEQQKQQQQQDQKKDEQKPQNQPQPGKSQDTNATDNASNAVPLGRMTPEQAKQILDSQKNEEKAMIFIPPDKANSKARVFRDW